MPKATPFAYLACAFFVSCLTLPRIAAADCILSNHGNTLSLDTLRAAGSLESCRGTREFNLLKNFMKDAVVIGIPGFHNEDKPRYFGGLNDTVNALGGRFVRVNTNSRTPIQLDAERVCGEVTQAIAGAGKAIIIGHSKGGATALYMFKFCGGALASDKVRAVISANGVVRGTSYADFAVNSNVATKAVADEVKRHSQEINDSPLLKLFMGNSASGVFMTTEASLKRLQDLAPYRGLMQGKSFCIAGDTNLGALSSSGNKRVRDLAKSFARFNGARNDGLVDYDKQYDSGYCPLKLSLPGANHLALLEDDNVDPGLQDARMALAASILLRVMAVSGGR